MARRSNGCQAATVERMVQNPLSESNHERLDRIKTGVDAIRSDWRAHFAILIAAPDQSTRIAWTSERFQVDEEVAAIASTSR